MIRSNLVTVILQGQVELSPRLIEAIIELKMDKSWKNFEMRAWKKEINNTNRFSIVNSTNACKISFGSDVVETHTANKESAQAHHNCLDPKFTTNFLAFLRNASS